MAVLYTISDTDNTGAWTPSGSLATTIDVFVPNSLGIGNYIANDGSASASETFTLKLTTSVSDPLSNVNHYFRWYAGKVSGGADVDFIIELRQGYVNESSLGTLIATATEVIITDIYNSNNWKQYDLTSGEADSITDYTDLFIRCYAQKNGGGANRDVRVYGFHMNIPEPPTESNVSKIKVASWKDFAANPQINIGGTWKTVSSVKINIGGVWKDVDITP